MAFFDRIFKKQKKTEPHIENIREIMVAYRGKRIVYEIKQELITYKQVTLPRTDWGEFPAAYFDVYTQAIPADAQKMVHAVVESALSGLMFTDTLDVLPPGASHDALMTCTKETGERMYYSNCRVSERGFSVQTEPVGVPFLELFDILDDFCEPEPVFDDAELESNIHQNDTQDRRYFEETIWICGRCSNVNLMAHTHCIKCGSTRSW